MSERFPTSLTSSARTESELSPSCVLKTNVTSTGNNAVEIPLYACVLDDTIDQELPTGRLAASFVPVDVYGSKGYKELYFAETKWSNDRKLWKKCDNVYYCYGPAVEGEASNEFDRYRTRWKFLATDGWFNYGAVGNELQRISNVLFPSAYDFDVFSVTFDQNARPVFALENNGTIEIRRLEAGILTATSFEGTSPVLYQNALLQPNTGLHDVVCYYLRNGNLYGRWQRDEFGVEYELATDLGLTDLKVVNTYFQQNKGFEFLLCLRECQTCYLISERYPLYVQEDTLALATPVDDSQCATVILGISQEDVLNFIAFVAPLDDGYLESITKTIISSDAVNAALVAGIDGGGCVTVIILGSSSSYTDSLNVVTVATLDDSSCVTYVQLGGSYAETTTTSTLTPLDNGSCIT